MSVGFIVVFPLTSCLSGVLSVSGFVLSVRRSPFGVGWTGLVRLVHPGPLGSLSIGRVLGVERSL